MYIEVRSIAMKIRRYRFPYGPLEVIVRRRLLRLKMRLGNVAFLVSSSVKRSLPSSKAHRSVPLPSWDLAI